MGLALFLVAMCALAVMSSSREERQAARQRVNERYRWLWIPTLLIFAALLIPG